MENRNQAQTNSPDSKNIRDKKVLGPMLLETGMEFGVMLALPLLIFISLGKWLDTKYNHHIFVILGLFMAIGLSCYMIYKKIKDLKRIIK